MKYFFHILGLLLLLAFSSCTKNREYDLRPMLNTANDNILSQRPFHYGFFMLIKAALDTTLQHSHYAVIDGASVCLDPSGKTYTFDFLDGTFCGDSVARYGSFSAFLDTNFFVKGAKARFTFIDYFEDSHRINGLFRIENTGLIAGGKLAFSSLIDSAVIIKDSVHDIHWKGNMVYEVNQASILSGPSQAIFSICGEGSGVSSMGFVFHNLITDTLLNSLYCPWIKDGKISLSLFEGDIRSGIIEFMGKSACNDRVDYNFEGRVYHLWLKESYLRK